MSDTGWLKHLGLSCRQQSASPGLTVVVDTTRAA